MFLGLVKESLWIKKKINSRIVLHAGLRFNTIAFPLTIWKYRPERNCIQPNRQFCNFYIYYTSYKIVWYLYILEGLLASRSKIYVIKFAEHIVRSSTQPHQWSTFDSLRLPQSLRWEVWWSYNVILVVGMEAYPWILEPLDSRSQKSAALLEKKKSILTIIGITLLWFFISVFNTFVVTN